VHRGRRHDDHQEPDLVERLFDLLPPTNTSLHFGAVLPQIDLWLLRLQLYPQVSGVVLTILAGVGEKNPGCPTEAIPTHVLGSAKG
jgi:hypothetical protein